jgi:hypothetical protein
LKEKLQLIASALAKYALDHPYMEEELIRQVVSLKQRK